ncbi:MAG TPA: hypothetical protein VF111_14645 [Thermoanaerobaculia bacterium]
MTGSGLEIALLASAVLAVAIVFTVVIIRRRGSATLPAPVRLFFRITLGIVFLILGVIGSLLPVLQGWLFFLIAGLILFPQSRFAIKALDKIEPKMPRLVRWLHRMGIGVHRN